ncbi:MAG: IMP cyclohydrolase / Phosphoribosylaminoimidazolecarboxamide formyltransferase, partial [uncultured Nocardioides sp.]
VHCARWPDRPPSRPRVGLRQDRARRPRPRPPRRRCRARLDRRQRDGDRGPRSARRPRRGPHRVPRVPRRSGQDPAPPRARRHPGRPPPRLPRAAARGPRGRPVRPRRVQPLPVRRDRRDGRLGRRVRRADRHRRAVDGPRRGQEPPVGRHRDVAGALRRGAHRSGVGGVHPRRPQGPGCRGVRAHRDVRRARGVLDGQRPHRHLRRLRLPRVDGCDLEQGRRAAVRREPSPVGRDLRQRPPARRPRTRPGGPAARQGDVLQQLRRRRRRSECGLRLRPALGG